MWLDCSHACESRTLQIGSSVSRLITVLVEDKKTRTAVQKAASY
jgi:hypothetical protein